MGIHRLSQVGRDALAQPAHHVVARRREKGQGHGHRQQLQKPRGQGRRVGLRHQAVVDQAAHGPGEGQGGARRQQQENRRQRDLKTVGPEKDAQSAEGLSVGM